MNEGMLWFDNDPKRGLIDKVDRAAKYYQAKLRHRPTVCYLNAEDFDAKLEAINGVLLKPASNIRPNYFWLGVENNVIQAKAA